MDKFSPMVKFLPVTDWEVLTLDRVYELWKILKEQRENAVEDSIKTWSLNNNWNLKRTKVMLVINTLKIIK